MNSAVVMLSGGIDSTVVLAELASEGVDVEAITFDYGQSLAVPEIECARANAGIYARTWQLVPMSFAPMAKTCVLLSDGSDIPAGRSLNEISLAGTPPTYVPLRNAIFLAWCASYAEAHGITRIYGGCNGLNSGNYRDDTREFGDAMTTALRAGCSMDFKPEVIFPLAELSKADVVCRGAAAGIDMTQTYSCYLGQQRHCGNCDSCVWRRHAMNANGMDIEGNNL